MNLPKKLFFFINLCIIVNTELTPQKDTIFLGKQNKKTPNILILLADDVGYGDMNFLGNSVFNTTNLNILSRKGTILSQLYSPTPLCTPSRAGILTGRHPVRYGVAGNYSEDPFYATEGVLQCNAAYGLPHTEKTIAQFLNETGYDNYIVGKWHLGQKCEYLPHTFGFKEFYGVPYAMSQGYFQDFAECTEEIAKLFNCPAIPLMLSSRNKGIDMCTIVKQPFKREELADLYVERVKSNIEDSLKNEKPFFMFMSFAQAHIDCKTETFFSKKEFLQDNEHYRASINEMDYMVGEINEFLKKKNLLEDTLIIFTSDNGNPAYSRELQDGSPAFQGSNGPFVGGWSAMNQFSYNTGRCSTWEGGMRVPGFVVWEGHEDIIKSNSISHQIYSSMDILPTVLNLVNQTVPSNLDGKNILENLYEKEITNRFIHYYRGGAFYAIRYGKWKFHLFTRPGEECGYIWSIFPWNYPPVEHKSYLIFDLNQDPEERRPLKTELFKKKYPEIFEEVVAEIRNHRESMKNSPPSILEQYDEDSRVCCDKSKNCHCD